MKTKDAIALFGSVKALADAIGVWPQAIYQWGDEVPKLRQYEIRDLLARKWNEVGIKTKRNN